jgi:hypothetical protein
VRAIRGTEVPIEHLTAELAAVPFASDTALQLSLIELDPRMKGASARLWRGAESSLLQSFAGFGVEEVTSLRDWLWFRSQRRNLSQTTSLVDFLQSFSAAVLSFSGNSFRPQMPPWAKEVSHLSSGSPDAQARRFWRWVAFALPPDLLMAAHPADNAVSAEVELLSPILASILRDRGYVEPHLHLGAALDFDLFWIAVLHALSDPSRIQDHSFQSPGAELSEGRLLAPWLVRAAIARYVLAAFLAHLRKEGSKQVGNLDQYLLDRVFPLFALPKRSEEGYAGRWNDDWRRGAYADPGRGIGLRLCLHELATGVLQFRTPLPHLQRLYVQLTNLRGRFQRFPERLAEARQADPIATMFPPRGAGRRTSEMEMVAGAMEYLQTQDGREDLAFRHLFWQSQRVRTKLYRHVVQRPLTPGLQWFTRFFSRLAPGRGVLGVRAMAASAAETCGVANGLRSLEIRISPQPDQASFRSALVEIEQGLQDLQMAEPKPALGGDLHDQRLFGQLYPLQHAIRSLRPQVQTGVQLTRGLRQATEFGVVLHFARERGGGTAEGLPKAHSWESYADPQWPANLGFRYAGFYRRKRREALAIAGLLQRFPQLIAVFRGVDVCNDELGTPNWVMAPLLRYVKDVAGAASSFAQANLGQALPTLRTTAHAGEDFAHLLTGLRRIQETIELFHLGQGDRLGHGIALGVHASEWAARTGGIAMTKIERLFDLTWEWNFCTDRSLAISASRTQYILDKVETLAKEVFDRYAHPPELARFMQLLGDERELRLARFPNGPLDEEDDYLDRRLRTGRRWADSGASAARRSMAQDREHGPGEEPWRLLHSFLTDPIAFERGQKQVMVDPAFEAESLELIQAELRRTVAATGLTVEINPSSNLLIGNLSDLQNHPLWRLKPPFPGEGAPIAVCIGSDDPITFSTRNREEYQLVYDTLTLAGLSDTQARSWLEEVRQAGLESRFTLPLPQSWDWTPRNVNIEHVRELL